MIRHDNPFIQFYIAVLYRQPFPGIHNDFTFAVQSHFSAGHIAESTFAIPRTHRHEVCSGLGIVMAD
jgi:hypothetical protein